MPATAAATAARKRKQTEDMEQSPPKRVTRARAAAKAKNEEPAVKKASNTTTGSKKKRERENTDEDQEEAEKGSVKREKKPLVSSAASKSTKVTAASTKRTTRAKAEVPETVPVDVNEEEEGDEAAKEDDDDDELAAAAPEASISVPKSRARSNKAAVAVAGTADEPKSKPEPAKTKTRGRPPKAAATASSSSAAVEQAPKSTRTQTRVTRAAKATEIHEEDVESADDESDEQEGGGRGKHHAAAATPAERVPKRATRSRPASSAKGSTTANMIKITAPSARAAAAAAAAAATTTTTRATAATASTTARAAAASKKRVAFAADPQDKENVPVRSNKAQTKPAAAQEKLAATAAQEKPARSTTATTASGLRAKPVRKAAGAASSSSSSGPAKSTTNDADAKDGRPGTAESSKPSPLSPKKVNQVAKGNNASSSEDELGGARSPIRMIQRSPVKPPPSARKELPFANSTVPSPSKPLIVNQMSEPLISKSPIKPPASARKDLLFAMPASSAASPIKGGSSAGLGGAESASPLKKAPSSLLMSPAKRPPVSHFKAMAELGGASGSLITSPAKKGPIAAFQAARDERIGEQQQQGALSTKKQQPSSFLQTPARKPRFACALTTLPTEKKGQASFPFGSSEDADSEDVVRALNFSAATPRRLFPRPAKFSAVDSPPLSASPDAGGRKVANSPPRGTKEVSTLASHDAPAQDPERSDADVLDNDGSDLPKATDEDEGDVEDNEEYEESQDQDQDEHQDRTQTTTTTTTTTTPAGVPSASNAIESESAVVAQATSKTNRRGTLFRSMLHEDSEDELSSSGAAAFRSSSASIATPTPTPTTATAYPSSATKRSGAARKSEPVDLGMTPLAHQFSAWPAPATTTIDSKEESGAFSNSRESSPFKPFEGSSNNLAKNESPVKPSFFEDEMFVHDEANAAEELLHHDNQENGADEQQQQQVEEQMIDIFEDDDGPDDDMQEQFSGGDSTDAPSQQYGDENAMPLDPRLFGELQLESGSNNSHGSEEVVVAPLPSPSPPPFETADPLEMNMTPARAVRPLPREVLTVSKVPLKPAADDGGLRPSPVKGLRKKAKSLAPAPLGEVDVLGLDVFARPQTGSSGAADADASITTSGYDTRAATATATTPRQQRASDTATPTRSAFGGTPGVSDNTMLSLRGMTPMQTPRRVGADAQILRGAVVFVDVHTTEGADASGIFVELLAQMGARCVKQWAWKPSPPSQVGSGSESGETPGGSKVGITHVVFKDGGKRTLEKVRETQGLVICVGVGWVLDCERENKWLDEADYAVDTSLVPRGGHNRRKSMEPRSLTNVNGTLLPSLSSNDASVTTPGRHHQPSISTPNFRISPTKEFLNLSASSSNLDSGDGNGGMRSWDGVGTPTINFGGGAAAQVPLPETPAAFKGSQAWDDLDMDMDMDMDAAPETPYYVSRGAELMQQQRQQLQQKQLQATCPPKQQTGRMLFPASGRIEDEPDEEVRRRLVLARRKSLQWAPKVGSPLRRE